jgi:hypothetical protein
MSGLQRKQLADRVKAMLIQKLSLSHHTDRFRDALNSWASWGRWQDAVIARYRPQGARCPLATLMSQVDSVPGASQVAISLLNRWQEYVRQGITGMQAQGDIAPQLDAQSTAAAFIAGIQGGVTILRATGDTAHLEAIFGLLTSYLRAAEPTRTA